MALLDLSLVTSALIKLLDENIKASPAWGAIPGLTVSGLPPDRLGGDSALGMYCYHLTEDAAHKNATWAGRPTAPIRYSPMGLNLHYVLSARSELEGTLSPLREQLIMGLAVKTLHDYPIVDDTTQIAGVTIFPASLRGDGNRLRIQSRPVPPHEAVTYYTAGSLPMRLSAYYEVLVILLEPEEPPAGGGRVLTYNILSFVGRLPRLDTSRSSVVFTAPDQSTPTTLEVQPAQCAVGDELTLIGTNLTGDQVTLLVRRPGAAEAVEVDPAWGGVVGSDRFFATVRGTLHGAAVVPGTYGAVVKTTRAFQGSDGTTRDIERLSNETPFLIVPAVTTLGPVSPSGVFTVTGGVFQDPALPSAPLRVYLADTQLEPGTAGALAPAEFAILDAEHLELRLPSGLVPGDVVPLRIVFNGAESPPRWVEVP
jgi:hypothetical protein